MRESCKKGWKRKVKYNGREKVDNAGPYNELKMNGRNCIQMLNVRVEHFTQEKNLCLFLTSSYFEILSTTSRP